MKTYLIYNKNITTKNTFDKNKQTISLPVNGHPLLKIFHIKYTEFVSANEYKELREELQYNPQFKEKFNDAICNIASIIDSEIFNDMQTQQQEINILEHTLNEEPKIKQMKMVLLNNIKHFYKMISYQSYLNNYPPYLNLQVNEVEDGFTNAERKLQIVLSKIILQDSLPISSPKRTTIKI